MKNCISGPPMTKERFMWTQFSSSLLISLNDSRKGNQINDNEKIEKFLNCLENLNETRTVYEHPLKESHTCNPEITYLDIHSKLAKYLADENNLPSDDKHRKVRHWESKELSKLLGDLKNCCRNILEEPEKRQIFGHEAQVFEEVCRYFKAHPYSENRLRF